MPDTLKRTPLHAAHRALGARLVPFSGWEMPVQYAGVIDEVRAVREDAGLFDVSHMGQVFVGGAGAHAYLQGALSNDLDRIGPHEAQYTLLPNEAGGIVDDLIAYRRPDGGYLLVVNAGNIAADVAHLEAQRPGDATLDDRSDQHGMVALQGPKALALLAGASEPAGGEGAVGRPRRHGAVHLGPPARGRGRLHRRAHGLHRRAGRRADLPPPATSRRSGTR